MIFCITLIVIWCFCYKIYKDDAGLFIFSMFLWTALTAFVCVFSLPIAVVIFGRETSRINNEKLIFSLKSENLPQGNFVLGSGQINAQTQYYYFCKDGRGAYYQENLAAQDCFIFENDEVAPKIKWQTVTYSLPKWVSFFDISRQVNTKYDLIVPSNTVIQKFEVK